MLPRSLTLVTNMKVCGRAKCRTISSLFACFKGRNATYQEEVERIRSECNLTWPISTVQTNVALVTLRLLHWCSQSNSSKETSTFALSIDLLIQEKRSKRSDKTSQKLNLCLIVNCFCQSHLSAGRHTWPSLSLPFSLSLSRSVTQKEQQAIDSLLIRRQIRRSLWYNEK
jgi:hypothetical protein